MSLVHVYHICFFLNCFIIKLGWWFSRFEFSPQISCLGFLFCFIIILDSTKQDPVSFVFFYYLFRYIYFFNILQQWVLHIIQAGVQIIHQKLRTLLKNMPTTEKLIIMTKLKGMHLSVSSSYTLERCFISCISTCK